MIFLIHYDRRAQRLERFDRFADHELTRAQDEQLALELSLLDSDRENEIALFKAEDEAALRLTHGRYFYSMAELAAQNGIHLKDATC